MNLPTKISIQIAAIFMWIGFVGAISFMEAWLKFSAPGITIALGLGIGRLVFNALSNVEWLLFIAVLICSIHTPKLALNRTSRLLIGLFIILTLQRIWLLPALDLRAEELIQGNSVAPSFLHVYYVVLEVLKLILLTWVGVLFIRYLQAYKHTTVLNYKPINDSL